MAKQKRLPDFDLIFHILEERVSVAADAMFVLLPGKFIFFEKNSDL